MEIWRDIPGFESYYQASNLARIKSLERIVKYSDGRKFIVKEKILKKSITGKMYFGVSLSIKGKSKKYKVSVLVAMAFLGHIPNGYKIIVDHKDNIKTNDFLSNIQLISTRENTSKDRKGTSKFTGVHFDKTTGLWKSSIIIKGKQNNLGRFDSEIEASNAYQNKLNSL